VTTAGGSSSQSEDFGEPTVVTDATRALTRAREKPVPWKESRVVDQREEFIHRWLKMREPVTTLA
jgi:hypothetical protein